MKIKLFSATIFISLTIHAAIPYKKKYCRVAENKQQGKNNAAAANHVHLLAACKKNRLEDVDERTVAAHRTRF